MQLDNHLDIISAYLDIRAHFIEAIFLTLEDSPAFALIPLSKDFGHRDAIPFCKISFLVLWIIYHKFFPLSFNL